MNFLNHKSKFIKLIAFFIPVILGISSCSLFENSAKHDFNDGYYFQRINGKKQSVYKISKDDTLVIYTTKFEGKLKVIDTLQRVLILPSKISSGNKHAATYNKSFLDIDFFTIPLKYRPSQVNVPAQLNANLNGALYVGFRNDRYALNYFSNPLGCSVRKMNHLGFSIGVFSGLGNTFMSPTNTNNGIQQEYDGVVSTNGIAGVFAVNNITFGLSVGFDHLLDHNRSIWIYQNKPWFGLVFGIHLN
jgi:hypothetical protein